MTLSIENYTFSSCHNSKRQLKSTWLSFIFAAGVALSSAVYPSVSEARGALMNLPSTDQETPAVAAPEPVKPVERARAAETALPRGASSGVIAMVTEAAERHGVPVGLAHAIIKIESGYNCRAHSRYGAAGIGQVLPTSARAEGVSGNLYDCGTGLEAAMRYLKHAVALYGSGCEAASAYNTGLFRAGRCTGYGRRAMRLAQLFK
jgi:soluble lytic murein transglycosylase-like protein